jgi:hypothetical protein
VESVILTGITNTLIKLYFSSSNTIVEYGVLTNCDIGYKLISHFGFSKNEIKSQILDKIFDEDFVNGKTQKKSLYNILYKKLKFWFYCLVIGNTEMFNPHSIMRYFHQFSSSANVKFTNYWEQTGMSSVIQKLGNIGVSDDFISII